MGISLPEYLDDEEYELDESFSFDDQLPSNERILSRPSFPAVILEPDLDDGFFSDVFSNLNTGLQKKPSVIKTEIPLQNEPTRGRDTKTSRLNELLRDCNIKARELNERLRALNATLRERLGE